MDNFWEDLMNNLSTYYQKILDIFPSLVIGTVVLILFWIIGTRIGIFSRKRLSRRMDDPLLAQFVSKIIKYSIITIGIILSLNIVGLGTMAAGLFTGASVSALVIGFAFKDIGENFLAGIMMAFSRPFRVGDVVELAGQKGSVVGLALRDTHIKTFDGKDVYIPNGSIVKNPVVNYTIDGYLRMDFAIGIDYDDNPDRAIELVINALEKVEGVLQEAGKTPFVMLENLNVSTVDLKIYFWTDTITGKIPGYVVKNNAMQAVKNTLVANEFYLPADIIEIKNYKDRALPAAK